MTFAIGEVVWHVEWSRPVQIAGPVETWPAYKERGELVTLPIRAYRVVFLGGEAGSRMLGARPEALRKLEPQQKCSWVDIFNTCHYVPEPQ